MDRVCAGWRKPGRDGSTNLAQVFDLPTYLERIGLFGKPTLAEVHRAHVTQIPFENLDPLVGIPVSLAPEALMRKLVDARRGGYCFEHNLLFKSALEALGARVDPILARVRNGQPAEPAGPLTHLLLRVEHGGALWHADVGFGQGTLLEPIPFGPGGPYEQSGWVYRVVKEEDGLLALQTAVADGWRDLYAFSPTPVPPIDIEVSNWFTCTHPESRFVTRLLVTEHGADGSRTTLSDFSGEMALSVRTPTGDRRKPIARDDVANLLERRFGLREPDLED
jgi:N-hydroxyarylamine O-acetyltransferase